VPLDDGGRRRWAEQNEALAAQGLRVLALAGKETGNLQEDPYCDLVFEGLVAMEDPPRADVRSAIAACREAGIRVVMVTGDQPVTARRIAQEIGLFDSDREEPITGRDLEDGTVSEERVIFGNIRKFVIYLLSCNTSEVAVVGMATVVNAPLPLLPLQILFLNLVTDVFPALALGVGQGDPQAMKNPPRDPVEAILPARLWWRIGGYAFRRSPRNRSKVP